MAVAKAVAVVVTVVDIALIRVVLVQGMLMVARVLVRVA